MKMHSSARNTESFMGNSNYHRKKKPANFCPLRSQPRSGLSPLDSSETPIGALQVRVPRRGSHSTSKPLAEPATSED